ncbi:MAG: hypothetical protein D6794_01070, partial [Deltaproteobacteria bacterium]
MTRRTLFTLLFLMFCSTGLPGSLCRAEKAPAAAQTETTPDSVEERRLMVEIARQKEHLRQREEALKQRALELDSMQVELEKKLEQLTTLRADLEKLLKQKDAAEQ